MTNFPNGVASFGVPLLPNQNAASVATVGTREGNVFWVDSGSTVGPGNGTFNKPYLTVAAAVAVATASNDDTIYVKAGHAETFTAAVSTWAKAGVAIVGLGAGSERPTFTLGTVNTATIQISSVNMVLSNLVFLTALDGLNVAMTISAAGCKLLDVEFQDTSATVEADIDISTTGDNGIFRTRHVGFATGDNKNQAIELDGADNVAIHIDAYGSSAQPLIRMANTAVTNLSVRGRITNASITNTTDHAIGSTGSIVNTFDALIFDGRQGCMCQASNLLSAVVDYVDVPYQPVNANGEIMTVAIDTETVGTTVGTIFKVYGQVLVTEIVGEVTTAINNASGTIKVLFGSTGGGLQFCSATTHAADAAGTLIIMPRSNTEVALLSSDGVSRVSTVQASTAGYGVRAQYVLGGYQGADQILTAREGVATAGVTRWTVRYVPISPIGKIVPLTQA